MPTSRLSLVQDRRDRRDSLGRRIGYNWWREYNCTLLLDAELTWARDCEAECMDYATEIREYKLLHPRPTLKAFLLHNKGMNAEPEYTMYPVDTECVA